MKEVIDSSSGRILDIRIMKQYQYIFIFFINLITSKHVLFYKKDMKQNDIFLIYQFVKGVIHYFIFIVAILVLNNLCNLVDA